MKAPWVNTILLVILIVQVASGYMGMINNEVQLNWVLWTHSIGAYAIVVMLYWKGTVIFDAVRRKSVWTKQRIFFMLTLLLLIGTIFFQFYPPFIYQVSDLFFKINCLIFTYLCGTVSELLLFELL